MRLNLYSGVATLLLMGVVFVAAAQGPNSLIPVEDQFGLIHEFPVRTTGEEKGSLYLNEEWRAATLELGEAYHHYRLADVPMRLDLKRNLFEINTTSGIKILSGANVDRFEWIAPTGQETYVNSNAYTMEGAGNENLVGFLRILVDGSVQLLVHPYLEVKRANYSAILDAGTVNDELIRKETVYLAHKGALSEFNKNRFGDNFPTKEEEMKRFVKLNRLKTKKIRDLTTMVEHYNSLTSG